MIFVLRNNIFLKEKESIKPVNGFNKNTLKKRIQKKILHFSENTCIIYFFITNLRRFYNQTIYSSLEESLQS